ncbi:MAG TPA: NUDIX domain-containing protein [Glycomyces sp.]|nr:NUDIX domain-containing protein [Glycomyces sp.]
MPNAPEPLAFRQRAASYVLRRAPERGAVEVLVILHVDTPEAGVQVPGGGALPGETVGEAAVREAREETGAAGLALDEAVGNVLERRPRGGEAFQVSTYCLLSTAETRDAWEHEVSSHDDDGGLRFRCEFRPVDSAGIDWGMDRFLALAAERFAAGRAAPGGPGPGVRIEPEPLRKFR